MKGIHRPKLLLAVHREAIYAAQAVPLLLDTIKSASPEEWGWEDAVSAAAVMGIFHDGARAELVRGVRRYFAETIKHWLTLKCHLALHVDVNGYDCGVYLSACKPCQFGCEF